MTTLLHRLTGGRPPSTRATPWRGSGADHGRELAFSCRRSLGGAAREISGVSTTSAAAPHGRSAPSPSASPAARASTEHRGVSVEVGEKQAAIDLDIVVEYGVRIAELAQSIRRNVIDAVEQMTSLAVVEVNINVNDLHLADEGDDQTDAATPRVQ